MPTHNLIMRILVNPIKCHFSYCRKNFHLQKLTHPILDNNFLKTSFFCKTFFTNLSTLVLSQLQ